jgi:hypothetical protein
MKDRKYWIRLKTTIEHFDLPIDIWNVGNAANQRTDLLVSRTMRDFKEAIFL